MFFVTVFRCFLRKPFNPKSFLRGKYKRGISLKEKKGFQKARKKTHSVFKIVSTVIPEIFKIKLFTNTIRSETRTPISNIFYCIGLTTVHFQISVVHD